MAELKEQLARKEKEMVEMEKRTSLEIKQKEKRIAELESDISDARQSIEQLTRDKVGSLQEVESLNRALSQRGE